MSLADHMTPLHLSSLARSSSLWFIEPMSKVWEMVFGEPTNRVKPTGQIELRVPREPRAKLIAPERCVQEYKCEDHVSDAESAHENIQKRDKMFALNHSQCMFGMVTFTDTLTLRVMQRSTRILTPREDSSPQDPSQRETHNTEN
jgi:hypothetical protein